MGLWLFFSIFIVVKEGVKLFIREGEAQLAGILMYLLSKEIWTFNYVTINRSDGIFLRK